MQIAARFVVAALVAGSLATAAAPAPPVSASANLANCTEASFRAAVAQGGTITWAQACTVPLASPIGIPAGLTVTIDGGGGLATQSARVTLDAQDLSRHFNVTGGTLKLKGIRLARGRAQGTNGGPGPSSGLSGNGEDGSFGSSPEVGTCPPLGSSTAPPGGDGDLGEDGKTASDASAGTAGGDASGASLLIDAGTVELSAVKIESSQAIGGSGGNGGGAGTGGNGGAGGAGGSGGDGFVDPILQIIRCPNGGTGGDGVDGSNGGHGGMGGKGGTGGNVRGGIISNKGSLTMTSSIIVSPTVRGGAGGTGGNGGAGGNGGKGGSGGDGGRGSSTKGGNGGESGNGGDGGFAGDGDRAGEGGQGGTVIGGAIANEGTLTISGSTWSTSSDAATGGAGGAGGVGGAGGNGGYGGPSGFGGNGATDSESGGTFPGGNAHGSGRGGEGGVAGGGGFGGQGGGVVGGGIYNTGTLTMVNASVFGSGTGGLGGAAGTAGRGGAGGHGGNGAQGGLPSPASKPGSSGNTAGGGGGAGAGGPAGLSGTSGDGGTGGSVQGGAIATEGTLASNGTSGSSGTLVGLARGGAGGPGAAGAVGGTGGQGGTSGPAVNGGNGAGTSQADAVGGGGGGGSSEGPGGWGGAATGGGRGGHGGGGGAGGGGALMVLPGGSASMTDGTLAGGAVGGAGGSGAKAGDGGVGGAAAYTAGGSVGGAGGGGPAGFGSGGSGEGGTAGGGGGPAGNGGNGGDGGRGGSARGGGMYSGATTTMLRVTVDNTSARGGEGGPAGAGGFGGTGGSGGKGGNGGSGGPGAPGGSATGAGGGGPGTAGGAGGLAGVGGDGGNASGGGIHSEASTWHLTTVALTNDRVTGGAGGAAANGGTGGRGGAGGDGGISGTPGADSIAHSGIDGAGGGGGGKAGVSRPGGSAGPGGSAAGGGLWATTAPSPYTGVTYAANTLTPGVGGAGGCVGGNQGCGGAVMTGGPGGLGGSGSPGHTTFPPAEGEEPVNGKAGSPGAPGLGTLAGANGPGPGPSGTGQFPDCSPPTCGGNSLPVSVADAYDVAPGALLSRTAATGVLANDTDANGQSLTATLVTNVSHGTLALSASGAFTYAPTSGYKGSDSFAYKASDGVGFGNTVAVTIQVDRRPSAGNDGAFKAKAGTNVVVAAPGVLANDTDPDGDPLTAVVVTQPAHGTLTLDANGGFQVVPSPGAGGSDTFTYSSFDGQLKSAPATVSVFYNRKPVAVADSFTTPRNTALSRPEGTGVLVNDTDADNDGLSTTLVTNPAHGTLTFGNRGSFTYTPMAGFVGADSFTYKVSDGTDNSAPGTVSITVTGTTAPPYAPFASWAALVDRVSKDLSPTRLSSASRSSWIAQLTSGAKTEGDLVEAIRRGTDHTTAVDPVARLYRAFLGPTPDASGLKFWVGRKRTGASSVTRMADEFAKSSEFKRKYGTLSNRAFVTLIYTDVLGRAADPSGVKYWTSKLDKKQKTRGGVMVGFSESNEYKRKQAENTDVAVAFIFLMGRSPTADEASDWTTRQKAGTTNAVLAKELLDSAKYATHITG